jgi:hypothetical protein
LSENNNSSVIKILANDAYTNFVTPLWPYLPWLLINLLSLHFSYRVSQRPGSGRSMVVYSEITSLLLKEGLLSAVGVFSNECQNPVVVVVTNFLLALSKGQAEH